MTIKKVGWMEDWNTNNYINEVQGGQEVMLNLPPDLKDLIKWWREWKPVFEWGPILCCWFHYYGFKFSDRRSKYSYDARLSHI